MHYFGPLNTFMRKGKDSDLEPDPDPYLRLIDLDPTFRRCLGFFTVILSFPKGRIQRKT
jgi:hypothetical protein